MRYQKGHIITGRDIEIEKILLTLCKSSKRGVILVGEPGVGKSLPLSSPILVKGNRWSLNGKLMVGDKVIARSGKEATVLGVFPQGKRDVYRITFKDGRSTLCTKEHLWKVYSKNWKRLESESRVIELDLIRQIKEHTRERLYIDLYSPENLPKKELIIDPYILGVLLGDGCITEAPRFTNQSEELIKNVEERLLPDHSLTKYKSRKTYQLRICSKLRTENLYWKELNKLSLAGNYAHTKFIPDIYKEGSIEQREDLIAGLLDTDGSVGTNGSVLYYTTSKTLADDVCYIIRSLGGIAKITEKTTHYKYHNEDKAGRKCYVVSIRYKNTKNLFKLTRKKDRLPKEYQYEDLKLEIVSVKKEGESECQCIYIDDPEHLYITDDFIVTHNTAIVNAINARLIERNVPRQLIGAQILNLDIPYVFTKFKEDPMGTIIKVLERASSYDKAILFIDEVHQLLGHKMNDIMKPYLTEQIRFIGSTTINEYHSIITDDVALERRFTVINVLEPSIEQTIAMVKGTKSVLEEEHRCSIPDDVAEYTVVNGSRFLGHRKNPDKSLDLLDIACAIMDEKEAKVESTRQEESQDYVKDLEINRNEIRSAKLVPGSRVLTKEYANLAISSVTNIPFGKIKDSLDYKTVLGALENEIFGQTEAVRSLANVVNIFKHVKYDRERPVSTILIAGPSGTGKKSAAKLLARSLYGKASAYIEYDMSGMTSEFMITELKGAPPGYVGYGKSGGLIKAIRNNPQSIVYFRGINKADESIIQYVIDASRHGKITDSAEREASLNNTVIIFGVTLSDEETEKVFNKGKSKSMGFGPTKVETKGDINHDELKKIVGEDLMKAVDETIIFNQLSEENLKQIFDANIQRNLEMYDVDIDRDEIQTRVLSDSKNGHDVVSRLTSEVPKLVFQTLKQE